jgi:DNA-binding Xre family transcriptional regulator
MYLSGCTSVHVVTSSTEVGYTGGKRGNVLVLRLRVKEIAQEKGFSMGALSRASNISFNNIKKLFREPYTDVRLSTLEQLSDALGVSVCDLFEKEPAPTGL